MTEEKPENPHAFFVECKLAYTDSPGMSSRDWFAGLAMQSLVAHGRTVEGMKSVAVLAYAQADAMLAERVRK
jgi:hypothetical protein